MEAVTGGGDPTSLGVCFLFPPKSQYRWLNPLWWPTFLRIFWDQYWVKPSEPFADRRVRRDHKPRRCQLTHLQRIEIMMNTHYEAAKQIKSRYPPNSLYYLEIAAVRPDTQGMGVGGSIMRWVVNQLGDSPCFLECTNEKNIGFYEKYGFKLVDEKRLVDSSSSTSTTFYYMVKQKAC